MNNPVKGLSLTLYSIKGDKVETTSEEIIKADERKYIKQEILKTMKNLMNNCGEKGSFLNMRTRMYIRHMKMLLEKL